MDLEAVNLLKRIGTADTGAFAEFYDRFAPRVLGLLKKIIHDEGDAQDVLQDTFLQVWNQAAKYDPERAPPEAWLFMLARSRALDWLRRKRPTPEGENPAEQIEWINPGAALEDDETNHQMLAALAHLPEEQQSAIRLSFFSGLTHEQIAARQNIPLGTAKTRIRMGMQRLRSHLEHRPSSPAP